MHLSLTKLLVGAVALMTLAACTQAGEPVDETAASPRSTPTSAGNQAQATESPSESSPSPAGTVVDIRVQGDEIRPLAERIPAKVGDPVTLNVSSNRPGELHVHSEPEQTLEFGDGTTLLTVVVERPGVVDVEEHDTGKLVIQLEVR